MCHVHVRDSWIIWGYMTTDWHEYYLRYHLMMRLNEWVTFTESWRGGAGGHQGGVESWTPPVRHFIVHTVSRTTFLPPHTRSLTPSLPPVLSARLSLSDNSLWCAYFSYNGHISVQPWSSVFRQDISQASDHNTTHLHLNTDNKIINKAQLRIACNRSPLETPMKEE